MASPPTMVVIRFDDDADAVKFQRDWANHTKDHAHEVYATGHIQQVVTFDWEPDAPPHEFRTSDVVDGDTGEFKCEVCGKSGVEHAV